MLAQVSQFLAFSPFCHSSHALSGGVLFREMFPGISLSSQKRSVLYPIVHTFPAIDLLSDLPPFATPCGKSAFS